MKYFSQLINIEAERILKIYNGKTGFKDIFQEYFFDLFLGICNEYTETFKLPKKDENYEYNKNIRTDITSLIKLAEALR